jgi:hypothetical protein
MPCRQREQRCASDQDVVLLYLEPVSAVPLARATPVALCAFDVSASEPPARSLNDFLRRAARSRRYSRDDFEHALPDAPVPAALLMPAPLHRFLAQVGHDDMLQAIESILWDAAPAQFPVPRHPNRFSYALDEVLLALTDTHDSPAEFWRIPIHALPATPPLPEATNAHANSLDTLAF